RCPRTKRMPRQYSMGGRMPPQGAGGVSGAVPRSMRERMGALRNLPPFLKLVWQTSPAISVALVALRLIRALLPVATLYVGALIIDAVVGARPRRLAPRLAPRRALQHRDKPSPDAARGDARPGGL